MKPHLYGLVNKLGEPYLCGGCVAESESQFDGDWLDDHQLNVVPLYTSPQIEKMREELERLQKAHDHQYNMAGLMLREAERNSADNGKLRNELTEAVRLLREIHSSVNHWYKERCEWCGCHDYNDEHSPSCEMTKTGDFLRKYKQ
jgi:hypothetical protein